MWEHHGRFYRLLVEPLLDLEQREVVSRIAGDVARPEVELRRLVGELRIGHEDRMPGVVGAPVEIADYVVIGEDVASGADNGAGARPTDKVFGCVVVGDYLDDGLEDVESNLARQVLCKGSADQRESYDEKRS